jgi:transposase
MIKENQTLPDNIEELKSIILFKDNEIESKSIIINAQLTEIERTSFALQEYRQKYEQLSLKYNNLQKLFFGKKSEKLTPEEEIQSRLFNEAEKSIENPDKNVEPETTAKDEEAKTEDDIIEVKGFTRKRGRKPIPADIPRKDVIHDISPEEKKCPCCGENRPKIGQEESEELDYIPAKIQVLRHIFPKYGSCDCDGFLHLEKPEVISAPAPKRMIPGSIASDGLLSYVFTSKFCDALPFYRLSKMLKRINVDISRATMCNWQIGAYENMDIFFEVFAETLKRGNFIRMDETTVQVICETDRAPESKSYMWVAIGYPERGRPLVLYKYHPSRAGYIPMEFLEGFKGYIQTDGYAAYDSPAAKYGLVHVGCFAHARREFFKAYDANKNKNSRTYKILLFIRKIYEIESDLRDRNLPDNEFVEKRKNAVAPILEELYGFLVQTKEIVTPSSLVGQAVNYTLNEWGKLIRYLDLACMTPDNNEIERSIKSFVIGRKNWMFSFTPRGAHASAGMYSLIESAKANGLDPYLYLRFLFSKLPDIRDNKDELRKLLPCFLSPEDIMIKE